MTTVAIVTPCLVDGDAVSFDVLGMYNVLTEQGHAVEVFAETSSMTALTARPARQAESVIRDKASVLIYHFSIGWDYGLDLLRRTRAKRVIKYHNVTPPEYFAQYDDDCALVCRAGREQLSRIATAGCDLYLADSEFNRQELVAAGAPGDACRVVYPFHQIDRLSDLDANLAMLERYNDGRTNILFVGRVVPNKAHDKLIDCFAAYHYDYNSKSRLLVVGREDPRMIPYTKALRQRVASWGMTGSVVFTGGVTEGTLKSCYLVADVFVSASEHEGFCVPLVESMAMKIPIVAYGSSAVPGTVGTAGLVWDEWDVDIMAASIDRLMTDEPLRYNVGEIGRRRYEGFFTTGAISDTFRQCLAGVIG